MDNRRFIARRAAQYFNEGDTVNLGIGIPSACSDYVDPTIAFQTENGMIGVGPVAKKLAICDTYQNAGGINFVPVMGASAFDTAYSFAVIRSGRMAATVLGALQVAENGDIANWASPGRAFGMGGAMDLCAGCPEVIITMLHTQKGNHKILKKCTLPLTAERCVTKIITEMAVMEVREDGIWVTELHPDYTWDELQAATGCELHKDPNMKAMEEE